MAKLKVLTYAEDQAAYWGTQALDPDATVVSSGVELLGCSRASLKWTRTVPSALREDVAMTSIWVAKTVGGNLWSMIPLAELASLETALFLFNSALASMQENGWTLAEIAWHQVNEHTPRTAPDPTTGAPGTGQKMGPATRTTIAGVAGTVSGTRLPDQVAETITLRTVGRRHWGRLYIPGLSANSLQTDYGRWLAFTVDSVATAFNSLHDTWQTAGYQIGVWSQLHPAFLTVKQIECDDVPDIVRRRRPKQTGYRKIIS